MQVLIADQSSTVLTFPDSEDRPCSCTFALIKSKPTSKVRGRQLLLNGEKEKKMLHCTFIYPGVFSMLNLGRPCRKRGIIGENEIHLNYS